LLCSSAGLPCNISIKIDKGIWVGNKRSRTTRCSILPGLGGTEWKHAKDRRKRKNFRTTRWITILQGIALGPWEYMKCDFTY
jgi:hypothetical protein